MNIFVLDPDPAISASYHCDQHLHKMILESAQMVSTAMALRDFRIPGLYKPAYPKHPCTRWIAQSNHNIAWVCKLALELDSIRQSISNCGIHSSAHVIKLIDDYLTEEFGYYDPRFVDPFIFAGPSLIRMKNLSVPEQYQSYYRAKHLKWIKEKGVGMTWKGREIPAFMNTAPLVFSTTSF